MINSNVIRTGINSEIHYKAHLITQNTKRNSIRAIFDPSFEVAEMQLKEVKGLTVLWSQIFPGKSTC